MAVTEPRLRLALALLCLSALPGGARAEDRAGGAFLVYADSDAVTIVAPRASGTLSAGDATFGVSSGVDVISAASVDLVSAASPQGFTETRVHADGSARYDFGGGRQLSGGYSLSREPDFLTHAFTFGGSHDLFDRRVTLSAGFSYGRSAVGRRHDLAFERLRHTQEAELTWSQVLSPVTAVDLTYAFTGVFGFQSNPYRFVLLYSEDTPQHHTAVRESTPDLRLRHAAGMRLRSQPLRGLFVLADYRFYGDTWGMRAHTATVRGTVGLGEAWTVSAELRGHSQGGASFYRSRYETFPEAPEWRTAEKELGPMRTGLAGLRVERRGNVAGGELRVGAGADLYAMRYLDHALLSGRTAVVAVVDAAWTR